MIVKKKRKQFDDKWRKRDEKKRIKFELFLIFIVIISGRRIIIINRPFLYLFN